MKISKEKHASKSKGFSSVLKFLKNSRLKIAALVMVVVTLISSTPAYALNVGDKSSITRTWVPGVNYNFNFNGNHYGQLSVLKVKSTGEPLYCLEPHESVNLSASATAKNIMATAAWDSLSLPQQDIITRASIYGYDGSSSSRYGYSALEAQAATQLIIWDAILGYRTGYSHGIRSWVTSCTANIKNCYNAILDKMKDHLVVPTFGSNTVTLSSTAAQTITDSKEVLSNFNIGTCTNSKIHVTRDGTNELKIWCDSVGKYSGTITLTKKGTNIGSSLALTGAKQTMLYGKISDPVKKDITVNVVQPNGKITIVKTDEKGKKLTGDALKGTVFEIYEWVSASQTWSTKPVQTLSTPNSNGEFVSSTLKWTPSGTGNSGWFRVVEKNAPPGYFKTASQDHFTVSPSNTSKYSGAVQIKNNGSSVTQEFKVTVKNDPITGIVKVIKADENGKKLTGDALKGTVFEIYEWIASSQTWSTKPVQTLSTPNNNGEFVSSTLKWTASTDGWFRTVEKNAPDGYLKTDAQDHFTVSPSNTSKYSGAFQIKDNGSSATQQFTVTVKNDPKPINIRLTKVDYDDPTKKLSGGEFQIWEWSKEKQAYVYCQTLIESETEPGVYEGYGFEWTTDNTGWFEIHETKAPPGYENKPIEFEGDALVPSKLHPSKFQINRLTAGQTLSFTVKDNAIVARGSVIGYKVDRETNKPIKGALFGLFSKNEKIFTEDRAWETAQTDAKGIFRFEDIDKGSYLIKELEPANGYLSNDEVYPVTISENEEVVEITVVNDKIPELKTTASINGKKDAFSAEKIVLKDTVEYQHLVPGKEYTIKGSLMNKATNKAFVVNKEPVVAETTFTAKEANGSAVVTFEFNASAISETTDLVVFEDLYLKNKKIAAHADINDEDQTVVIHAPKSRTIATVNNEKDIFANENFTIQDIVSYSDLIPGREYTVKGVLMNKATNEPLLINGKEVKSDVKFTSKKADGEIAVSFDIPANAITKNTDVVVFEELYYGSIQIASHKDINDKNQTIFVHTPEIGTAATINEEKDAFSAERFTIEDVVTYSDLIPGKEYTVKGVLMNKATGEPFIVDDEQVISETTFTAAKANGSVVVTFEFDASVITEKTELVAFEELYKEDIQLAVHADINDENQTVTIHSPKIRTTATVNSEKDVFANESFTIKDIVSYSDLIPGNVYLVKGILMDKATGKPILINGKEVESAATFTAKNADGKVTVSFDFPANAVTENTDIVVFEELYYNDIQIADHKNINDKGQTITVHTPEIGTTATVNEEKSVFAAEEFTVKDTVAYSDLVPGREYKLIGTLMNKVTNSPLVINGKPVQSEVLFTPETAAGTVIVSFSFDRDYITANTDLVVFEELYYKDIELASHKDIEDIGQTVTVLRPSISTVATVKDEKDIFAAEKTVTLSDVVSYVDLIPGKEYTLKGVLMNKATNKPFTVNNKPVVAETTFTAKKANGSTVVTFEFDASVISKTTDLVAFEELYKGETLIVTHADINDANQTITVHTPEIGTTATVNGKKEVLAKDKITLEDDVAYSDLIPGKEYIIKGALMNKATGKPFEVNGKPILSNTVFVSEKANGTVTVAFEFDSKDITKDTDLVVFEEIYEGETLIGSHMDINDENQTVKIKAPKIPEKPHTGDTGVNKGVVVGTVISGAVLLFFFVFYLKRRTKCEEKD